MMRANVVLFAISLFCSVTCSPVAAGWDVTVLAPAGSTSSGAYGVLLNQQIGSVIVDGKRHASIWSGSASSWADIHPTDAVSSSVTATSGDQQVGYAYYDTAHAYLWSGSASNVIDLNPSAATESEAVDLWGNQQVGDAVVDTQLHASLWTGTADSWIDLNPAGATRSAATSVFDGKQGGYAIINNRPHAGYWIGTAESWVDIHPVVPSDDQYNMSRSCVMDMYETQQVGYVSYDIHPYTEMACMWSGSADTYVNLHHSNGFCSYASAVCENIQVGAVELSPDGVSLPFASLWRGTSDSWVNLHDFLPSGYRYSSASDVFVSSGEVWVVGSATTPDWKADAILWHYTPVPEPSSFVALFCGAVGLCALRRRRG